MITWALNAYQAFKLWRAAVSFPAFFPWLLLVVFAALVGSHLALYQHGYKNGAAKMDAVLQAERAESAMQLAIQKQRAKEETDRLTYELTMASTEWGLRQQAADADLLAAHSAGERLQARIDQLAGACQSRVDNTASEWARDAADASARMLALMLRRVEAHGRRVVEFADDAHIAGIACEQQYNTVRERSNALVKF